jgi:hypothetical protein
LLQQWILKWRGSGASSEIVPVVSGKDAHRCRTDAFPTDRESAGPPCSSREKCKTDALAHGPAKKYPERVIRVSIGMSRYVRYPLAATVKTDFCVSNRQHLQDDPHDQL